MSIRIVAILAVAALAAAGCAAKAPSGTLKALDYKAPVGGSIVATYQPFVGANPTGAVPMAGQQTQCAQGSIPPQAQPSTDPVVARCKGPYSTFSAQAALPEPSAGGYKVYAVGPGYELEVMSLKGSAGSFAGTANVTTEDLSAKVKTLEVRMDGVAVASAPGTAGNHTLALAPTLAGLTVTGTFSGKHLDLSIAGLPANGTFVGRLYAADPASPTGYSPKESFEVHAGTVSFDSPTTNIGDYAEFHIHVGASAVNLYKAAVTPAAK
ncbi:MAG: hypothetical protein QOG31_1360 [Thermoplasmata archaeon]|jgi:hypothetical protein|nr:hypothetical protein [Thermoplasmata archaeon]